MEIPHYYARMIYLDRIKPCLDTQIIKVLVGQRRVGKSFMLFQLMDYIRGKNANADIRYINKELFENKYKSEVLSWYDNLIAVKLWGGEYKQFNILLVSD